MHLFSGETADDVWRRAASHLLDDVTIPVQTSRNGDTKELLHTAFSIRDPLQRWVVSRTPALNPAFALVEVIWILSGRNDAELLNFFNPSLPKFAGSTEHYHGAYGFRLRHQFGLDQLERAYYALLSNPDSRQIVLQIWDPRVDLPNRDGSAVAPDIPCNISSVLKVRNGRLHWLQVLRSNDLYLGVPYNFVQFTTLQEIIAGWLGIMVGEYVHVSDSLHIYTRDLSKKILDQTVVARKNTDTLALPKQESDAVIRSLGQCADEVIRANPEKGAVNSIIEHGDFPSSYKNVFRVVAAEVMRRSEGPEISNNLMSDCSNPGLSQVWEQWQKRTQPANQDFVGP